MKTINIILSAAAFVFLSSCGSRSNTQETRVADTVDTTIIKTVPVDTVLNGKLAVPQTVKAGQPIQLRFTVYNNSDSTLSFCKWHTPFEPLMSKYLDITSESGEEVMYKGPMAKRVMPPPADAYIKVKSKDSISVTTDLLKAYSISKPGKYWVKYNSEGMSGVSVKDSVMLIVSPPAP